MDCKSSPTKRFWTITFPLLAPTTFFLMVINITYAFFETFGIIDTTTQGAPGGATNTLVYQGLHRMVSAVRTLAALQRNRSC